MGSLMVAKNKCQAHFLGVTSPNPEYPPLPTKEYGKTPSNSEFHAKKIESALILRMNQPHKPTEYTILIVTGTTGSEVRILLKGARDKRKRHPTGCLFQKR